MHFLSPSFFCPTHLSCYLLLLKCSWLSEVVHTVCTITEIYSCEVNTHTASPFSELWSPESWQSRGGCEWCQCLRLWLMLWMSLCWDYQRLGMATQWKCYDWPHALPDCVLIGCDTRILRLKLRQSAGFVVSGKYYRAYILIKGGDFIVPSNLHDRLRLAPHKHRSAVVCELGNIAVDLSL